ncbi:hypothetical protein [Burkholderia cenocepacia]|uniref:hypothetical protein n=1 Tax=Burkholderia cenocepacia TaxID=95486 RepID=UPI0019081204|nr:hypothetical protein [Burkholderia cenocepacia]MBJ9900197.1 hypothetical protein [Burkholderia cenocepacia]MBJ9919870.1 hypothetical protein [Burkholderia cenocepacia]MBR8121324.1 hypothetical protein [Burkholderia cenocepacia]MBR8372949.1 hypothetical protein [Burkholderia cenocepacia]MBR8441874.1 hypothetical protein [Burkholderia cenocepacia]
MSDQGNTVGRLYGQAAMSNVPAASANPPVVAETAAEAGWFSRAMGYVHGGLDVLGAIPEVGAVFDGANGLIYAAEGDYAQAAISGGSAVADLVPGLGTAGKAVKYGAKGVAKLGVKEAAEQITKQEAKILAEKEAKQLAEQEAKQAAEQAAKKAEKETAEKAEREAASNGGKGSGKDGGKIKGGPCDHLKQGSGKGPYRGGAHSKTSKPANDGKDSHHMPADDVSPLKRSDGPAIQMDPDDHAMTSSNGQNGRAGKAYRSMIGDLLRDGKWREAMLKEILDVRRLASEINDGRKYNEAMLEMLEYFKCLERNGLLPKG